MTPYFSLFILISTGFSFGCGQATGEQVLQQERSALYDLKNKFKFQDLTDFPTDTFSLDTRAGHYDEVDSNAFKLIFTEGDKQFIGQGYDRDYYYSWQNRDSNFIEFTILTQDESSYCNILRYYIFDKDGKFISKFDIAANCGDADWTFSAKGKQVDKNRFVFETVEADRKNGTMPEDGKMEGDSINYLITTEPNGKLTRTEIFKKHFADN